MIFVGFRGGVASHKGFTLIEVLLALAIMAMIAALTAQSFNVAATSSAATKESMDRLARVDGALVLIENDLNNALAKEVDLSQTQGPKLPAMKIAPTDEYMMTVLRGGFGNPLFQPRSEEVRVGYRFIDNELWRDTWINLSDYEQQDARQRRILEGVESVDIRALPQRPTSILEDQWRDQWPLTGLASGSIPGQLPGEALPLAVRLTIELEDMGEIVRIFTLLPGRATVLPNASSSSGSTSNSNSNSSSSTSSSSSSTTTTSSSNSSSSSSGSSEREE